ncbi:MAG: hypothetical protein KGL39_54035, partial [Patescibacteria group bacterium]|nr:hypothetical protein [Patescibacteria group bacterium]
MIYLGRQVFPFAPNWAQAVQRSISYDLRSKLLGFGAEYFTPTATYTVNTWSFSLLLATGADLLAFEDFCDALVGRLNGFWLPCPLQAAQWAGIMPASGGSADASGTWTADETDVDASGLILGTGISKTQFKIAAEGLADSWNARPDQHLFFTFGDGTQGAALIQGVVDNGDGTETVTLTTALAQAPDANTLIQRLHYVRFGADEESYEFEAENIATSKISVVELPLEYTDAETGLRPIYLYHFWMKAPVNVDWFYTSFASA